MSKSPARKAALGFKWLSWSVSGFPLSTPLIPAKAGIQTANAVESARECGMAIRPRELYR